MRREAGAIPLSPYIDNAPYGLIAGELRFFNPARCAPARREQVLFFEAFAQKKPADEISVMKDFSRALRSIPRVRGYARARGDIALGPSCFKPMTGPAAQPYSKR
jgi:hypothetical protein